ncbi:MAG: rRNA maturation RNase YbeY [Burkholderiales bacterium]|nr:rRNA maturation RNase YbeY [Burkholderiales bacterium]
MRTNVCANDARGRPSAAVTVQLATRARVPSAARLRRYARAALPARAEVTLRLVGEREARALNRTYRGRDYATNVLAFDYGPEPLRGGTGGPPRGGTGEPLRGGISVIGPLRGDITLCAPVLAREAREQGKPLEAHYAHLTVHAVLHLRGYRHRTGVEARRMEARERAILRGLGYPDPYRAAGQAGRRAEGRGRPAVRPAPGAGRSAPRARR